MRRILFTQLTREDLEALVKLTEQGIHRQPWEELAKGELSETEHRIIDHVTAGLRRFSPSLVNEATVWGKAIFPLLTLAEVEGLVAQAEVPLVARIGDVELAGNADGAFGTPISGELRAPFLIVVEAKRGIEGNNPVTQLYGEILAAAWLSAKATGRHTQRLYGCYTVADTWTFVRTDIDALDTDQPTFVAVASWEIDERLEAATIVKILKSIVAEHVRALASAPGS
jgi:hypothetical protein